MKSSAGNWDMFADYVLDYAIDCAQKGHRYVLVTLVQIDGSSPRYLGAQMVVSEDGGFVGYLSGGCIERAIVSEALEALADGESRLLRYGEGSKYFDIQLPCGSGIDLYFDVSQPTDTLRAVDKGLARRCAQDMALQLPGFRGANARVFTVHYKPRRRLVIAGSGPSAVQLCRLATMSGFDVEVFSQDDVTRQHAESMGGRVVALESPSKSYDIFADQHTAIVFMFHDHLWEENLIASALSSPAYYIGAMGNHATHVRRRQNLLKRGFQPENIDRIHGPAGVFHGAKSATNIAISILADIVRGEPPV